MGSHALFSLDAASGIMSSSAIGMLLFTVLFVLLLVVKRVCPFPIGGLRHHITYGSGLDDEPAVPVRRDMDVSPTRQYNQYIAATDLLDSCVEQLPSVLALQPEQLILRATLDEDLLLDVLADDQLPHGAPVLLDSEIEYLSIPVLEPVKIETPLGNMSVNQAAAIRSRTRKPWNGEIQWAIPNSTVFEDINVELDACAYSRYLRLNTTASADLWFFQYGLRYLPKPEEENVYRTVKIDHLPANTTMDMILPRVRGGQVYSAHLLNTTAIIGSDTALITFVEQAHTTNFLRYVAKQALRFGLTVARVQPVHTPTYPMTLEMKRAIFEDHHTRCIRLDNIRPSQMELIYKALLSSPCHHYIESVEETNEDEVCISFHSIKMAGVGHKLLSSQSSLRTCRINFVRDTCDRAH